MHFRRHVFCKYLINAMRTTLMQTHYPHKLKYNWELIHEDKQLQLPCNTWFWNDVKNNWEKKLERAERIHLVKRRLRQCLNALLCISCLIFYTVNSTVHCLIFGVSYPILFFIFLLLKECISFYHLSLSQSTFLKLNFDFLLWLSSLRSYNHFCCFICFLFNFYRFYKWQ